MFRVYGVVRGVPVTSQPSGVVWKEYVGVQSAYTLLVHAAGGNERVVRTELVRTAERVGFESDLDAESFFDMVKKLSGSYDDALRIRFPGVALDAQGDLTCLVRVFSCAPVSQEFARERLRPVTAGLYAHANLLRESASFRRNGSR